MTKKRDFRTHPFLAWFALDHFLPRHKKKQNLTDSFHNLTSYEKAFHNLSGYALCKKKSERLRWISLFNALLKKIETLRSLTKIAKRSEVDNLLMTNYENAVHNLLNQHLFT